jgi:acyl transferase domain-containing protein/thioesterase domain-containing protein
MKPSTANNAELNQYPEQVAIIGIAGRFPGARNIDEFWHNLREGIESIGPFTREELISSGVEDRTINDPYFVNAGAVMPAFDSFDAPFFGITVREAEIMDPQHRVFLESAWEALEDAGYAPGNTHGLVGVFGGVAPNTYFQKNLLTRPDLLQTLGRYMVMLGCEKDYAITRVSYKLNLTGPSLSVGTACSTSGVAIHLACQSLLSGECDMALAGGARITVPVKRGYLYEEGGILSPDGHCRAFDAEARGTVVGNGIGMVVLKRLSEAVQDGDNIYAVIMGSAINNDGAQKVGFTAPSVQGQAAVIDDALAMADISPDSIGYVEAHGTGTSLGDPIEIAALTKAYRNWTNRKTYCPIGSLKTNIGHLDAGAGVAGVIKSVMALKHKQIPPSLNFNTPNPQIDFENSPFFVNTELTEWQEGDSPRRAGVSSFGLGGTNAHIILEEAPEIEPSGPSRFQQLILLSAKTDTALGQATSNLVQHLQQRPPVNLADVAYTLQTGREAFNHRRMVVCKDLNDAITALEPIDPRRVFTSIHEPKDRDIVFMFSGQGSQYVNMGLELYESESIFKQQVDRCSEILKSTLGIDLRQILYPDDEDMEDAEQKLVQTSFTQPALFIIEYALAMLWIDWGLHPQAMVGHSIGEYVAACLAGVFSLEEALSLVSARGQLMQSLPSGSMLAIPLTEKEIEPHLGEGIDLAVVNNPSICVVSGEHEDIEDLEKRLAAQGVESRHLHTSHAFHSSMMDPILEPFTQEVGKIHLNSPQIPFVSNVTGTWITSDEATDPNYWAKHLRQTVRFSDCLQTLFKKPNLVLLELGPGRALATLARQHPEKAKELTVFSSTKHPKEDESDLAFLLNTIGRLWLAGVNLDWSRFYANERRYRISLPPYPFERKRYWINPGKLADPSTPIEPILEVEPESDSSSRTPQDQGITVKDVEAPRNEVEKSLAGIWQGLLGVDNLTIHDNFFELGGSSLLATRLFTQIANVFGERLPIATIFEAPTIEQLAGFLGEQPEAYSTSSLVKIQAGQSKPPFIFLPGNLGNVFTDLNYLCRHLGQDYPVYGFQDGIGHPSRVEDLAAHCIEDIREAQLEGPYYLGGICSGGVVAFEMAQQLQHLGEEIAFLALIEPASLPLPGARSYLDIGNEIWERFNQDVGTRTLSISRLNTREKIMYFRLKMKLIANIWALKHYLPQTYSNRFHLFLTKESITHSPRPHWGAFAGNGMDLHEIPGTHRSITGDRVYIEEAEMQVLAEKIRMCIDNVLTEGSGG